MNDSSAADPSMLHLTHTGSVSSASLPKLQPQIIYKEANKKMSPLNFFGGKNKRDS